jgi:hypothetical protein
MHLPGLIWVAIIVPLGGALICIWPHPMFQFVVGIKTNMHFDCDTNYIQRSPKLQDFLCGSCVLLLSTNMKHVVFMIKSWPPCIDIFWNESNDQKHCMQDLLSSQNIFANQSGWFDTILFFPIKV